MNSFRPSITRAVCGQNTGSIGDRAHPICAVCTLESAFTRLACMTSRPPMTEIMSPDWAQALTGAEERIHAMGDFLREELAAGREYLPAGDSVFRAFSEPLAGVKVLIVGQDPYPTPGHPIGLSFAVDPNVRPLPRSLGNIYKELEADLGVPPAAHGDLRAWSRRGVMLLNRVLTVGPGQPAARRREGRGEGQRRGGLRLPRLLTVAPGQPAPHRGKGWEESPERALTALIERDQPLVGILWGRDARSLAPLLRSGVAEVAIIESPHPSPLSASR